MANHDPLIAKAHELARELTVLGRLLQGFAKDLEEAAFAATIAGSSYLNQRRRTVEEFLAELDAGLLDPAKAALAPVRAAQPRAVPSDPTGGAHPGPGHPIRKRRLP